MGNHIAVDIGASSGRLVWGTIQDGRIDLHEIHRFKNGFSEKDGHCYWDIDYLFREVIAGLQKAKELGITACTLGIDTWAVDYALIDGEGQRLHEVYAYRDERTKHAVEKVTRQLSTNEIYEKTGIQFQPFNTLFQLAVHDPEQLKRAGQILLVPDYLHYLLTGKRFNEVTNASTTQLLHLQTRDYDADLLKLLGLDRSQFAELVQPGVSLGPIRQALREVHDLPDCEVICVATHDTASAVLGVPAKPHQSFAYLSSGTWSLMGVELDAPLYHEEARERNFTNEWGAFGTYRFLKNIMGMWLIQEVHRHYEGAISYAEFVELAKEEPAFTTFLDFSDVRFLNPRSMVREIQSYCRETGQLVPQTPGEIARCIYDNLAILYALCVEELEAITGRAIEVIHIVGGGSSNELLCQLTATVSGKKVMAGPIESTALGNLAVQMIAKGAVSDIHEARALIRETFASVPYEPQELGDRTELIEEFRRVTTGKKKGVATVNAGVDASYQEAKRLYAKHGIDVEAVLERLAKIKVSMHCWQGDDVRGFLNRDQELTGGIAVTGNYPGAARTPDELRQDLEKAFSLIPGKHKVNLHAIYADTEEKVEIDRLEPKHFERWVSWAKEQGLGLDFNPTCFSHEKSEDGFTLSHPDPAIRQFWIDHCKASRKIGAYFGEQLGQTCVTNVWIPDGFKDSPVDRLAPRQRLKDSLDEVFREELNPAYNLDAVESKVFGIGSESYVVGSHEFYMGYGVANGKIICLDAGHFHPTETISGKLSALALFSKGILLHVSRPVRWDSDHVVIMDDELLDIARELVRHDLLGMTHIGLDFFDGSINRIAAWVIGMRNTQKALLRAMLEPTDYLRQVELEGDYTTRLALMEEFKTYPFGAVWDMFCARHNVPVREEWLSEVKQYEQAVLSLRGQWKAALPS